MMELLDEFDFGQIEDYLTYHNTGRFSFRSMVESIINGDMDALFHELMNGIYGIFLKELSNGREIAVKIIIIGVISGLFVIMAKSFDSSYIADMGGYISYIALSTLIIVYYKNAYDIGYEMMNGIDEFMMVMLPCMILSVSVCSGSLTAVSYYTMTNMVLELVNAVFLRLVLPLITTYVLCNMIISAVNNSKIVYISRLVNKAVRTILRISIGVVSGMSIIKAMILPMADSVKDNVFVKTIEAIPGVGDGASGAMNVLLGSASLIKNSIGVASIIFLIILFATPLIKLVILSLIIKVVTSFVVSICDIRIANLCMSIDEGINLILKTSFTTLSLFFISISIMCISTNVNYFGG